MYSGHAKAFGLFAAMSFLQYHLSCYSPLPLRQQVSCFCNNSGVITSVTDLLTNNITRPNDTTNDDRDIYLAIHETTKKCGMITFQFWHVKGHQDADSNHQLTVEEQHNMDCDQLAKQYVLNNPLWSMDMVTPEFLIAKPHLYIAGKLICQRVLKALRQVAAALGYWEYLHKRYTWTHSDLMHIQWDMLKTSLNLFPSNDQCRLVLFMHDKLALRTSKFHPHPGSQLCPSCQRDSKDRWHFFECQHPARHKLFTTLKQSLAMINIKYSLHPAIFTTFWLGLLMIRNDTPFPDVTSELPMIICSTARAQT